VGWKGSIIYGEQCSGGSEENANESDIQCSFSDGTDDSLSRKRFPPGDEGDYVEQGRLSGKNHMSDAGITLCKGKTKKKERKTVHRATRSSTEEGD
jgi:hypothetical protein